MVHPGRYLLIMLTAFLIGMGYNWWAAQPRFPVTSPAADLVLQQADLRDSFVPVADDSGAIAANPYEDQTEHFRSGHRAVFTGAPGTRWQRSRLISTSFVLDLKGAEKVYKVYLDQTGNRGEAVSLLPLGDQSHFVVARDEASAPMVVIGAVKVKNVLITLTLMTDQSADPALVHGWAETLAQRAGVR